MLQPMAAKDGVIAQVGLDVMVQMVCPRTSAMLMGPETWFFDQTRFSLQNGSGKAAARVTSKLGCFCVHAMNADWTSVAYGWTTRNSVASWRSHAKCSWTRTFAFAAVMQPLDCGDMSPGSASAVKRKVAADVDDCGTCCCSPTSGREPFRNGSENGVAGWETFYEKQGKASVSR